MEGAAAIAVFLANVLVPMAVDAMNERRRHLIDAVVVFSCVH